MAKAIDAAKNLRRVLCRKSSESLEAELADAEQTALAGLAAGLRRDADAVQAARELPWTTSSVEGQINRLMLIKRTMYGRAGPLTSVPASSMPQDAKMAAIAGRAARSIGLMQ